MTPEHIPPQSHFCYPLPNFKFSFVCLPNGYFSSLSLTPFICFFVGACIRTMGEALHATEGPKEAQSFQGGYSA